MTKKIPNHLDDPVDNVMYGLCEILAPYFKSTNHTPNIITTYSLLFGIAACYALYKYNLYLFIPLFIISYFFDCFDGYFARRYHMTSSWGDIYDHTKDAVVAISIVFIIFYRYKITVSNIIITAILFLILSIHIGCQQKYYKYSSKMDGKTVDAETLDFSERMCSDKDNIRYTRFFGPGMLTVYTILMISWIYKNSRG